MNVMQGLPHWNVSSPKKYFRYYFSNPNVGATCLSRRWLAQTREHVWTQAFPRNFQTESKASSTASESSSPNSSPKQASISTGRHKHQHAEKPVRGLICCGPYRKTQKQVAHGPVDTNRTWARRAHFLLPQRRVNQIANVRRVLARGRIPIHCQRGVLPVLSPIKPVLP